MSKEELSDRLEAAPGAWARWSRSRRIELLLDRLQADHAATLEFLMQVQKTTPVPGRGDDD